MTWYKIPTQLHEYDIIGEINVTDYGEFVPTTESFAREVNLGGTFWYYMLTNEAMPFDELTDEEVAAQGLDPNMTL